MTRTVSRATLPLASFLVTIIRGSGAGCPFLAQNLGGEGKISGGRKLGGSSKSHSYTSGGEDLDHSGYNDDGSSYGCGEADFSAETYAALKDDIATLLTDSQSIWPADFGHYGGLMIRLAWHCSGTYRQSDGRGGCDGSRTRFNPERSWADNTNLDKALRLLQPLKLKYGDAVSWGDLITLTGNVAISSMGGPIIGFCAGRQDDDSGYASLELGPSPEQEAVAPCEVNGTCEAPLGSSTVGLIYVNPEGVLGVPEPENSVENIRDVFGRMGMNDSETVALIGGGHEFGKFHGACTTGPGADPIDNPASPWSGTCGTPGTPEFGVGENTYTAGFEGAWTVDPTVWKNGYFKNLLEYDWEVEIGPGGHNQWRPVLKPESTETEDDIPDISMLTTDVALLYDPTYLEIVTDFAENQQNLDVAFSNAWYKLITRDMGPVTRCAGTDVPPAQDFQLPLPEASTPAMPIDVYVQVMKAIEKVMYNEESDIAPDVFDGETSYAALFTTLAFQCMDSFRSTDYRGGCNGARIRFSPQKDWAVNKGLTEVIGLLEPVKTEYPDITYADLIVLAGITALKKGGDVDLPFCPGRVDVDEGTDLISILEPREYSDVIVGVRDRMKIAGLNARQAVALAGRLRSPSQMKRLGFSGSYTDDSNTLSNEFYNIMLTETWEEVPGSGGMEFQAVGKDGVYVLATDLALVWDAEFKAVSQEYAADNDLFLHEFSHAWVAWMNADRFDGPTGNVCDNFQNVMSISCGCPCAGEPSPEMDVIM